MNHPGMHPSMAAAGQLQPVDTINIGQKRHPTADGVIDRAHRGSDDRELFIIGSSMDLLDPPRETNGYTSIAKASVLMYDPNLDKTYTFEDIGDANLGNCPSPQTGAAAPRMAATRAMSRALAQALNIAGAVAEEIAQGGSGQNAVQHQQQPNGAYQQQPSQQNQQPAQQGQPAQGGHVPAVKAQFPNAPDWKFQIASGNKKGTWIDDPTVDVQRDLLYWIGRGFFNKRYNDPRGDVDQAGKAIYDVPDQERAAIWQAEIARRQSGIQAAPTQPQPQQAVPNYGQPTQQQPAPQQAPAYVPPAAPQQQQAPQQPAYTPPVQQHQAPTPQGEWKATTAQIKDLMDLGKASGRVWPQVKQLCIDTFGHDNINGLDYDSHNMLRMAMNAQPI